MKNTKRWLFGLLSTCFLAVGLVRAAELLDPVSRELNLMSATALSARPTPDCITFCAVAERPTPDCITFCAIADDAK